MKNILKGFFIFLSIVFTSYGVGAAARSDVLIIAAVPFALGLILIYRFFLGMRAEYAAWAFFLFWLGMTYITPNSPTLTRELVIFGIYTGLAVAGVWISPWFIVFGFAAHIGWDFLPRELPDHFHTLPTACMLFDGIVAGYIAWQTVIQRWTPLGWKKAPKAPLSPG